VTTGHARGKGYTHVVEGICLADELDNNAKVTTTSSHTSQHLRSSINEVSLGGNNLCTHNLINTESVTRRQRSIPANERPSIDANLGTSAGRDLQIVRLGLLENMSGRGTSTNVYRLAVEGGTDGVESRRSMLTALEAVKRPWRA
jgi:hypothetical protein